MKWGDNSNLRKLHIVIETGETEADWKFAEQAYSDIVLALHNMENIYLKQFGAETLIQFEFTIKTKKENKPMVGFGVALTDKIII